MRRLLVGIAFVALLVGSAERAHAGLASSYTGGPVGGPGLPSGSDPTTFNFAFIGLGLSGSGLLTASDNGDGSFTATSGSLSVFGDPLATGGTLFPNPSAPGPAFSPSGFFIYDNQLFPTLNPTLDVDGLLFTSGPNEINIWANGPGSWEYFDFNTVTGAQFFDTNFQFFLTEIPEPASATLMALGVVGLAAYGVRSRRRSLMA
jgi:MYXO-CTERM domain-containing protein